MTKDWKEEFRALDMEKGLVDEGDGTELETKIQLIFKFVESNFISKKDLIKMIEEMQSVSVTNMDSDVKCSWVSKDDIIKELKK